MKTKAGNNRVLTFSTDLKSRVDVEIGAGETIKIPLGVEIDSEHIVKRAAEMGWDSVLDTHCFQLSLSNQLRAKGLISRTNIIDLNLKDEIKIAIHNPNNESYYIKRGDEIAEIALQGKITDDNPKN